MSRYRRKSPGVYIDTQTGKEIRSTTDPNKRAAGGKTGAGRATNSQSGFLSDPNRTDAIVSDLGSASGALRGQQIANEQNTAQNIRNNRVNEETAFGNLEYVQNPDGTYTRRERLSENQGAINRAQEGVDRTNLGTMQTSAEQAQRRFSQEYSLDGVSPMISGQALEGERRRVEDGIYGRFAERFEPQFQQERAGLEQSLRDKGIPIGSRAYNDAMMQLSRQQEDARSQARLDSQRAGADEVNSSFDRSLTSRQQGIGEYERTRYAPTNEMQAVRENVRGVVSPNFQQMAMVETPGLDVGSTALGYRAADTAQYNAQTSRQAAGRTGGGGGGGGGGNMANSIIGFQDRLINGSGGGGGGSMGGWGPVANNISSGVSTGLVAGAGRPNAQALGQPKRGTVRQGGFFSSPR